jgi:hypothetical protein
VPLVPDQGPVEQLAAAGLHPSLHERVHSRHSSPADRPLAPVLREFILRPVTLLDRDVKLMIAGQLDKAEDRFAAITD